MCGVAGIFRHPESFPSDLLADVRRITEPLEHRGPDDEGYWTDAEAGVGFGFRRLAIVDLSPTGHQPMDSATGRFTLVFNGEIYNHPELRRELEGEGARFRGTSDTEVALAAFERWGVERAIPRFVGMFAMAIWDRRLRQLTLARDRLGIKPLYVYARGGAVVFASELKSLLAYPGFDRTLDPQGLSDYLRYLFVPAPASIFLHVRKLSPGHVLTLRDPAASLPASRAYWSVEEQARRGARQRWEGSAEEAVDECQRLLGDAVGMRMRADVPVGAFLSGGVDSSVVVALMQERTPHRVRTFTVGFEEEEFNEAPIAAEIADRLGTDHTEVMLTGADALALVPRLPELFDEPLADPSGIPTWLVSSVARRSVTVALSGDGGDEVFAGYNRYTRGARMMAAADRLPRRARRVAAAGLLGVPAEAWNQAYRRTEALLPRTARQRQPGEKLHKIGALLAQDGIPGMYRSLLSAWPRPHEVVVGAADRRGVLERVLSAPDLPALLDRMMLADQLLYLPDDLLAKVDRASMAVSLEVRVPMLDHRFVEFAWRIAPGDRVRGGVGKRPLRRIAQRYLPESLLARPKMGFTVPIARWLRGPLRGWAEELLSRESLARSGQLRPDPVREAWKRLLAGESGAALQVWTVLMFQAWHERWVAAPAGAVLAGSR